MRALLELWLRSSRQLRLLALANGIGFVHIVQPNQYFSGKAFTDNEKALALSLPAGHEFRVGVGEGYRLLEAGRDRASSRRSVSTTARPPTSTSTTAAT